ncbi:MAG: hypothetical protein R3C29_03035 [Dehalococcoidia bacterium]
MPCRARERNGGNPGEDVDTEHCGRDQGPRTPTLVFAEIWLPDDDGRRNESDDEPWLESGHPGDKYRDEGNDDASGEEPKPCIHPEIAAIPGLATFRRARGPLADNETDKEREALFICPETRLKEAG